MAARTAAKPAQPRGGPAAPATAEALRGYARLRDRRFPAPSTPGFFVSTRGTRLAYSDANKTFRALTRTAGLEGPGSGTGREPDLRHSFAVATLLDWYREGADVDARLPLLSAMLGHANPASTYWYLQAAPSCWPLSPNASSMFWESRHDRARSHPAGVLHRPPRHPAHASEHTVAAYRDTFRLLLGFVSGRTSAAIKLDASPTSTHPRSAPSSPGAAAAQHRRHPQRPPGRDPLPVPLRGAPPSSTPTRSASAIHPAQALRPGLVSFLTPAEAQALLEADRRTWIGRRDHTMLTVAVQTGLRVSELTGLRSCDAVLWPDHTSAAWARARKERCTPLTAPTVATLRNWLAERGGTPATRCSRVGAAPRSAPMQWDHSSPSTPGQPQQAARRSPPRR